MISVFRWRKHCENSLVSKNPQYSRYKDSSFEMLPSYGIQWGSFTVNVSVRVIATRNREQVPYSVQGQKGILFIHLIRGKAGCSL